MKQDIDSLEFLKFDEFYKSRKEQIIERLKQRFNVS
jgi:hypothetical protein